MLRTAICLGLGAALFICAAFGFFFADIWISADEAGATVVVCRTRSKVERPTDQYSVALARSIAWLLDAQVRVESPTGTYTGKTTINGGTIAHQRRE